MAASKSYLARSNYRFLPTEIPGPIGSDSMYELDESEVWSSGRSVSPELRKVRKTATKRLDVVGSGGGAAVAASVPVKVPDWAKILKEEYRENRRSSSEEDYYEAAEYGGDDRVPPHEYLARRRVSSFSVHEGIGRTLKGRDLSRVRNAIWEKTGFQD